MSEGKVQVKVEPLYTDYEANLESGNKAEEAHIHVKDEPIWNTEEYSPASVCRDQVIENDSLSHTTKKIKKETEQHSTKYSQDDWCMEYKVKVETEVDKSNRSNIASQVKEYSHNISQQSLVLAASTNQYMKKEKEATKDAISKEAVTPSGLYVDQMVKIERDTDIYSVNNEIPHKLNNSESKVETSPIGHDGSKFTIQSCLSTDQMVKADNAVVGLYMDHVVKEELVVGPEVLQKPKLLPFQATNNNLDRCSVRLEKMHVETESSTCSVGFNTYKCQVSLLNYQGNQVKEEINHSAPQNSQNIQISGNAKLLSKKRIKVEGKQYKRELHGKVQSEKPFKCTLCSYSTANKAHFQIHERVHTGERPYKCDQCSYAAIQKSDLSVHQRVHSGEKPFKCRHCIFACSRKRDLLAHERTHDVDKRLKCEQCSYTSNRKRDMLIHVSCTHADTLLTTTVNDQNIYKCDHCSYTSPIKRNWQNHIRITHTKPKPYRCKICRYESKDKSRFETHVKEHTGKPIEFRFKCGECNYATGHKHHMLTHQRTHSGEKPFHCNHCSYATAYRRELVAHKALHNNENPYKCTKCSYACGSESHLRIHERTHIGENENRLTETLTETKKPVQTRVNTFKILLKREQSK
ncbi:zinc finger protein ZFP2-like [Leguminivora glycinivorella]|uniref:zinc finger protein ZFP2-like n=1 Tax=Leguminivora glycinivorella TaxID=1035111 RepID=UPI00200EB060|nr:zinc finger protein ZFP2-like [Leguminivora glycinivorella]